MSIPRHECPQEGLHEMHVYEIHPGERWACTGRGIAYYALTPEALAAFQELDLDTLKSDALDCYLSNDWSRREQGFRNLWNRWAAGKSNMPLCVEQAAEDPRAGDTARTVLSYLGRTHA